MTPELREQQAEELARASREQGEFVYRLQQATPRTFVTPSIVAVNVLVFVAMVFNGAGILSPEGDVHVRWGSNFGFMTASGEWWRLFTSMFLHFGIVHLALNMWALWDFGRLAERFFGTWTFLAMYLIAGTSGSLASLLWHPAVNSAGASGAVFGVFGMIAGYLAHKELGVPMSVIKRHWGVTLPFIGYNLFIGATVPGIDNAAHVGGLIAGLAMGYALARPLDPDARRFSRGRLGLLAAAAIGCAALAMKPLAKVTDNAKAEHGAFDAINSAIQDDKAGSEGVKEAMHGLESGKLAPEMAARKLDEAARRYRDANKRLASYQLAEGSRQKERHEALVRYTALRSEGYELLAQAIRTDDEAIVAKARERIQQSNDVVKSMGTGRR